MFKKALSSKGQASAILHVSWRPPNVRICGSPNAEQNRKSDSAEFRSPPLRSTAFICL
uniref:Uncharacterized protein n=1 Tax=Romanomermis culicivorax TaxID=13658 RepID=A0A915HZ28_ROMCU